MGIGGLYQGKTRATWKPVKGWSKPVSRPSLALAVTVAGEPVTSYLPGAVWGCVILYLELFGAMAMVDRNRYMVKESVNLDAPDDILMFPFPVLYMHVNTRTVTGFSGIKVSTASCKTVVLYTYFRKSTKNTSSTSTRNKPKKGVTSRRLLFIQKQIKPIHGVLCMTRLNL